MATIKEIIDYICETTYNTNPNVVRSFLENSDTEDEGMPADAEKIFVYQVPVQGSALDGVTVDELKAIEAKGVKLMVGPVEIKSVTDDTFALYGEDAYIDTAENKYYHGIVGIRKNGVYDPSRYELVLKEDSGDA